MISPNMIQLIERLYDRTNAEGLPWQETESDGVYQITFPTFSVSISKRRSIDPEAEIDYWVTIYNSDGKIIEDVSDLDVREQFQDRDKSSFRYMGELYEMARRTAMGVEGAITQILAQLR